MKQLSIAFLWHMHQPYYKNPVNNHYTMPWVRLHAIKAYYDMAHVLDEYPEMKMTFNLVPSLLSQLLDYTSATITDDFINYSLKPSSELTPEERRYLVNHFFMANWQTMIEPYPQYFRLLAKRGIKPVHELPADTYKNFTNQDLTDLQALYNLTWFGFMARKNHPEIGELLQKTHYTDDNIAWIISKQRSVMAEIIPKYKELAEEGRIEITTTPYYHPILPLLYDTDIAHRSLPNAPLPTQTKAKNDVIAQLSKAAVFYKELFGSTPRGIWPSEGSVCPELIPLLHELGISWIATDEEILAKSLSDYNRELSLFMPYKAQHNNKDISIFFRDRGLSDFIGFSAYKNLPENAVSTFIHNLESIYHHTQKNDAVVSVILDGENPWEHYAHSGRDFIRNLYAGLCRHKHIQPTTFSDHLRRHPPKKTLTSLHSGSWIYGNFDIWIGSEEENTAWEYLRNTRLFLEAYIQEHSVPVEKKKAAFESLHIAEGSDWFWWFGDDFSTDNDAKFDTLFRLHLSNVYYLLDQKTPEYLNHPIKNIQQSKRISSPIGYINPILDGKITHFYEWSNAGYCLHSAGAMQKTSTLIKSVHFGFNKKVLFVRIDPESPVSFDHSITIQISFLQPHGYKILFDIPGSIEYSLQKTTDDNTYQHLKNSTSIAIDNIIECAIPFKDLDLRAGEQTKFTIDIYKQSTKMETFPETGYISAQVPDKKYETQNWCV